MTEEESAQGWGPRDDLLLTEYFASHSLNSSMRTKLVLKRRRTETYRPFPDELKWLGMFTQVVAWIEKHDSELVLKKGSRMVKAE